MSAAQFDNGYWYATELKAFADAIGIPAANKLRKDELEKAIKRFLRTGTIRSPTREAIRLEDRETSIEGSAWTFLSLSTRTTRKPSVSSSANHENSLRA